MFQLLHVDVGQAGKVLVLRVVLLVVFMSRVTVIILLFYRNTAI